MRLDSNPDTINTGACTNTHTNDKPLEFRYRMTELARSPFIKPILLFSFGFVFFSVSHSDALQTGRSREREKPRDPFARGNLSFFSSLCQYISSLYFPSVLFSPITSRSFCFLSVPKAFFVIFSPLLVLAERSGPGSQTAPRSHQSL